MRLGTPTEAMLAVLDHLADTRGALFGVTLTGIRFEATDADWSWGAGDLMRADTGSFVSLLSGRTLPDGRHLPRT